MPRQPFLPAFATLDYAIGAMVLKERPAHCALIGKCIGLWTHVDCEMGNLFSILLGTESEAALSVFLTLRRSSNQREALDAAATPKLLGETRLIFDALMAAYRSLELQRNALAHGVFGLAGNDEDALLWMELKDYVHFQADVVPRLIKGENLPDPHANLKTKLFVYRLADLEALYLEMEQFWELIWAFNAHLRYETTPLAGMHLRNLRASPLLAGKLATTP